jgi:hypothetical protein
MLTLFAKENGVMKDPARNMGAVWVSPVSACQKLGGSTCLMDDFCQ